MIFEDVIESKGLLSINHIELVLDKMEKLCFKKNDFILKEGEVENYIYFIKEGISRFWKLKNNKEITCFFSFEGEYASCFESYRNSIPSFMNHQCITDLKSKHITKQNLEILQQQIPHLSLIIIPVLESFIFKNARRELDLISLQPEEYYLKLINEEEHKYTQLPLKYLASYLGISSETLSRIRARVRSSISNF